MMVNSGFPLTLSIVAFHWMPFEHEVGTDSIFDGRLCDLSGSPPVRLAALWLPKFFLPFGG